MAVHLIHVSKSGGTALRYAMRAAREKAGGKLVTQWGPVIGHDHRFRFADVSRGEKAVFALRDPISRFISGYYTRLRKGQPRYSFGWSRGERRALTWFPTVQDLADALAEPRGRQRRRAEFAMRSILHVKRPMTHWVGSPGYLRKNIDKVLYIARQETLDADWEVLKDLLGMPKEQMLPDDPATAHRTTYESDVTLSDEGIEALRRWYADDYELLEIAEEFRQSRLQPPETRLRRAVLR